MKRVFVFQDFKSQKFWSIDVVGTDVTVNYGKLGTDGQTQVKNYSTAEEAEKAANKLIAEKTKKGYVETAEETAREMKVEAKKYTLSYDEYENDVRLLDKILKDKHLPEYKQITIGCWDYEGEDCSDLLKGILENKDKFAHIEGLFWGDIDQEEQEISWIEQADLSPLLDAMPKLKDLKIKGTNCLRLGQTSRPELRSLEIISGGLPTEVVEDILASDFPNLEKLVATIRSREISACLVLQAQSQLKAIYKDNADTIIGNMDSSIFLGGKEPTTLKELAAVLGKETIDTYNTGESRGRETSHSLNYQKLGKELMSQDELAVMDGGKCILQLRGVRPLLSDKYDITKHPNYPYTADADPKNAFDIEAFLSTRLKLKPNEVYDVYEVDAEGV